MTHLPPFSLRAALWIDAIASGATGMLGLVLAGPLSNWTDLPIALLRGAGVALIPFVVYLVVLATRDVVSQVGVRTVIGINVAWVIASAGLVVSGAVDPNAFGYVFVIAQGTAVALFAELQATALGREHTRGQARPASA
jgi:hypothetical protein